MTSIKDSIRQASLFTCHGLVDPRLIEPMYQVNVNKGQSVGPTPNIFIRLLVVLGITPSQLMEEQ